MACEYVIQVFLGGLAQMFSLLVVERCHSAATQMGMPILRVFLMSWNKAVVVCLPHAGFFSS